MGKGLIPADLETWKQRRRGEQQTLYLYGLHLSCLITSFVTDNGSKYRYLPAMYDFAVIAPGFHAVYLEAMVNMFSDCSERTVLKFEKLLEREELNGRKTIEVDLEAEFLSLGLDIIGLGVFNYDFGSVTKESPVIKVW